MSSFIQQALNFHHLFIKETTTQQVDSMHLMRKMQGKQFEQFALEYYLVSKMEYITQEQLQRLLTAHMLNDLEYMTHQLVRGQCVHEMSQYKQFYAKYITQQVWLQLWFLWVQIKHKQILKKSHQKLILFYRNSILPFLHKFKNTLVHIKFELFHCYQTYLGGDEQTSVHLLTQVRHQFQQLYNLKGLIAELHLLKMESSLIMLPTKYNTLMLGCHKCNKEDFFCYVYLHVKMLYPISKSIAPTLAEQLFNEMQVLLVLSKQFYKMQQVDKQQLLDKKYTQIDAMLNKYYELQGIQLFKRRQFRLESVKGHKKSNSSMALKYVQQEITEPMNQMLSRTYMDSLMSIYSPQQLQILAEDVVKVQESLSQYSNHKIQNTALHSRRTSMGQYQSQVQTTDNILSKDMWLEIDNYQIKQHQRKKPIEKQSVNTIYRKLIYSVPDTKKQSIAETMPSPRDEDSSIKQVISTIQTPTNKLPLNITPMETPRSIIKKQNKPVGRIRLITVMMALNMKYYHLELEGSKRLPKLIAKHFLRILQYVDYPPYVSQQVIPQRQGKQKSIKVQLLRRNKKFTQVIFQPKKTAFLEKYKDCSNNFSLKTKSIVFKIRALMKMGAFKKNALPKLSKQQTSLGPVAVKPHTLQNFMDVNRRLKTIPDSVLHSLKDDKQYQSQPTPRGEAFEDKPETPTPKGNTLSFGLLKAITIAKRMGVQSINKQEVTYLQEKYGTLQSVRPSHYYYPSIKYSIFSNMKNQFWKLKYNDLTNDKNYMVISAYCEGKSDGFYRFDLPVPPNTKKQLGITIWPAVLHAIQLFDQSMKYSSTFNFSNTLSVNQNKRSFMIGLTQRARGKITLEDIQASGQVQSYFYNFHRSQIVQIKRIVGYSMEMLPNVKSTPLQYINLQKVNAIVAYINQLYSKYQKCKCTSMWKDEQIDYKQLLDQQIEINERYLSKILLFRFICTTSAFMIEGKPEQNLKDKSITLHSQVITIPKDEFNGQFLLCRYQYALFSLELQIKRDLTFNVGELLCNPYNTKPQLIYGKVVDQSYFNLIITCEFFFKESKQQQYKVTINPYILTIQTYHQLIKLLNISPQVMESLKFNCLVDSVLFQRKLGESQKLALDNLLKTYFEVSFRENRIILHNDYRYLGEKKVSIRFLHHNDNKQQLYAISPIESKLVAKVAIISQKDLQKETMFKLEQTQRIVYEDVFQGQQVIEEPDFMGNVQEIQAEENGAKQIPIYDLTYQSKCKRQPIKLNILSAACNKCLFKQPRAVIYTPQSYYVNHQMPSMIKLKTMILNRSQELQKYFNCNTYVMVFHKQDNSFRASVYVYYSFNRKLDQIQEQSKPNERIYYYDGEMFYISIQLTNLQSKTQAIKLIFSQSDLQELFRINLDYHEPLYCFNDKFILDTAHRILSNTYAERNFLYAQPTFLHNKYLQQQTRQHFIDYSKSISICSDTPTKQRVSNSFQVNNLKLLERHRNCRFVVLFDDAKEQASKYFCETKLKESRVIGHYLKVLNVQVKDGNIVFAKTGPFEYTIVTVYCHLILDVWLIQVYAPKTSRYLVGTINILDLAQLDKHDIFKGIKTESTTSKKSQFVRKQTMNQFISQKQSIYVYITRFFQYTRELSNSLNKQLIQQSIFSQHKSDRQEFNIWGHLVDQIRLSIKQPYDIRVESEAQNKTYIQKNIIEQLEQDSGANLRAFKVVGDNITQRTKNDSVENQEMLLHFKNLSSLYQQFLKNQQVIMIKSQIVNSSKICISSGFTTNLKEFIHKMQLVIDKVGLYSISFFLEYSDEIQQDNPFQPFQSINYANSSSYNLAIRIFGYQTDSPIFYSNKSVNVREVLNLFIADGYFKYQTNYMNAKLSLADLKQICEYVGFKIRTQNFLGLASQQRYVNTHPIFLQEQIKEEDNADGAVFTCIRRDTLVQIQLFQKNKKIHVNRTNQRTMQFHQQKLYFHQVDEIYPYFSHFVQVGLLYQAMLRFSRQYIK